MRVLVTGGTGFVGSHSVAALVAAGHDVRLLVRSRDRIGPALDPLGVRSVDSEVGDVTEPASVERALAGCDAVLHAASVYSFNPRAFRFLRETNVRGTEIVLGTAHRLGLDPIVHVSSFVALLPPEGEVLTPESPIKTPRSPYPRSKAESERVARDHQNAGAPVTIVTPGSVWGPHDPHFGESHQLARDLLKGRIPLFPAGGYPIVDVRDVAGFHAALMTPGLGSRRYLVAGHFTTSSELIGLLSEITGRRVRALTVPARLLLPATRLADLIQRALVFRLPALSGGVYVTGLQPRCDDSRARVELGFAPRDLRETIIDTVRSLAQDGRISTKEAGSVR